MICFEKEELRSADSSYYSQVVEVRFQDVDAAGVVYFARFFDYVHAVYEGFLREVGCALPEVLASEKWAAPLRHAEADYLSPARFGDRLKVSLVCARVEESELSLGWRLEHAGLPDKGLVALAQTVHTFIDLGTKKRHPVPSAIAAGLQ